MIHYGNIHYGIKDFKTIVDNEIWNRNNCSVRFDTVPCSSNLLKRLYEQIANGKYKQIKYIFNMLKMGNKNKGKPRREKISQDICSINCIQILGISMKSQM